jgi:hypothetical protein
VVRPAVVQLTRWGRGIAYSNDGFRGCWIRGTEDPWPILLSIHSEINHRGSLLKI